MASFAICPQNLRNSLIKLRNKKVLILQQAWDTPEQKQKTVLRAVPLAEHVPMMRENFAENVAVNFSKKLSRALWCQMIKKKKGMI